MVDDEMYTLMNSPYARGQLEPGSNKVIMQLPDHTGHGYRLTKDHNLRDWSSIVNTDTDGFHDDACSVAKMDPIKDVVFLQNIITFWWAQFRIYNPTLKPWKPGQSMADVNPQILNPDHPLRKCSTQTLDKREKVIVPCVNPGEGFTTADIMHQRAVGNAKAFTCAPAKFLTYFPSLNASMLASDHLRHAKTTLVSNLTTRVVIRAKGFKRHQVSAIAELECLCLESPLVRRIDRNPLILTGMKHGLVQPRPSEHTLVDPVPAMKKSFTEEQGLRSVKMVAGIGRCVRDGSRLSVTSMRRLIYAAAFEETVPDADITNIVIITI
ncbi:hypothetical protein MBLNU13_g03610t1 [Cladosporium sp. NU13]